MFPKINLRVVFVVELEAHNLKAALQRILQWVDPSEID